MTTTTTSATTACVSTTTTTTTTLASTTTTTTSDGCVAVLITATVTVAVVMPCPSVVCLRDGHPRSVQAAAPACHFVTRLHHRPHHRHALGEVVHQCRSEGPRGGQQRRRSRLQALHTATGHRPTHHPRPLFCRHSRAHTLRHLCSRGVGVIHPVPRQLELRSAGRLSCRGRCCLPLVTPATHGPGYV